MHSVAEWEISFYKCIYQLTLQCMPGNAAFFVTIFPCLNVQGNKFTAINVLVVYAI